MSEHAVLSPSAAERWIQCPASVRVEVEYYPGGSVESSYAAEGSKAHALGELIASHHFGMIDSKTFGQRYTRWLKTQPELSEEQLLEMRGYMDDYVAFLADRAEAFPNTNVLLEQRLHTGIEHCWGTGDAVLVSPEHVEIVDLKYGQGVPVFAPGNPQIRLYGVGALDLFGDILGETEMVLCTIYQPRLGSVSTEEISASDLRAWRDSLIPIAQEALAPGAHFGPSESACRWCPAAGDCRARVEYMTAQDFAVKPDLLSPEEIAELLPRIADIKAWCEAVANTALDKAYSQGVEIPGWKVVKSGGQRFITDQERAFEALWSAGFTSEEVRTTKLKGIGDLEKLIKAAGKGKLEDVLGPLVDRTPGKPALAHEDDPRPAVEPNTEAVKEFTDDTP
jgi:hypothetical protein